MAILVYYVVGTTKFQVVLLAHDSVLGRGGKDVFFARCCLGKVPAERPSVSYTKVTAKSQGQAISCNYTNHKFKQISGSNTFLIAEDGKMKRMREP